MTFLRKQKAYAAGNAWAYYSKFSKEGSREGKFMMYSAYRGVGIIVFAISHLAFQLFTA